MIEAIIERLKSLASLGDAETAALRLRGDYSKQFFPSHTHLFRSGDRLGGVHMIVRGSACRYRMLPDGRRQITAIHLPGDFIGTGAVLEPIADHAILALEHVETSFLPWPDGKQASQLPQTCEALWQAEKIQHSILEQWLINIAVRPALARVAHLFCELYTRLQALGLADGGVAGISLTQVELADVLAMTPVHVNRILKQLSRERVSSFNRAQLRVESWDRLASHAHFDSRYLRLTVPASRSGGAKAGASSLLGTHLVDGAGLQWKLQTSLAGKPAAARPDLIARIDGSRAQE